MAAHSLDVFRERAGLATQLSRKREREELATLAEVFFLDSQRCLGEELGRKPKLGRPAGTWVLKAADVQKGSDCKSCQP